MSTEQRTRPVIIGTAGHIDHGKSTLIKALTGVDPDRLKQEKERGITIELGFARLDLGDGSAVGVIDVPGHERFVRQMISGATGVDLALVCIAADDGIMPQTREHLAILELLGITHGIIVITKTDLVDEEWLELLVEEIRSDLAHSVFGQAPVVNVSAQTGDGLDELKNTIIAEINEIGASNKTGFVRLPIDRVFTIKGAGTVITGTLWQGSIALEDELELIPGNKIVRVRSIQVHDTAQIQSYAGNRTALNLVPLKVEEVESGSILATPGTLAVTDRFDARVTYLSSNHFEQQAAETSTGKQQFVSGTSVRIAHGTKEVTGRVLLMNDSQCLNPYEHSYAQIRLDEPLALTRHDRFIIRSINPVRLIGGGVVLSATVRRRSQLQDPEKELLAALESQDDMAACLNALLVSTHPLTLDQLGAITDIKHETLDAILDELVADKSKHILKLSSEKSGQGAFIYLTQRMAQQLLSKIESIVLNFHRTNPTKLGISKSELLNDLPQTLTAAMLEALVALGVDKQNLLEINGLVCHATQAQATQAQDEQAVQALRDAFARYAQENTMPIGLFDLYKELGIPADQGGRALTALEKSDEVIRLSPQLAMGKSQVDTMWKLAEAHLIAHGSAPASHLKDAMQTSRKYAIPLLEYFDAQHLTVRDGDTRRLRTNDET